MVREASRVGLMVDALRTELAELRGEIEVETEAKTHRAALAEVESTAARVASDSRRCWADRGRHRRGDPALAGVPGRSGRAGGAGGRIGTIEADLARNQVEDGEARERIGAGEERLVALGGGSRRASGSASVWTRGPRRCAASGIRRRRPPVPRPSRCGLTEAATRASEDLRGTEADLHRATRMARSTRSAWSSSASGARISRPSGAGSRWRPTGCGWPTMPSVISERPARLEAVGHKISALEPVNLIADEEYRELDERRLPAHPARRPVSSMRDLEKALRGMTRTAQERFMEAFEAINRNFQELFTRLFEGGRAELRLVEAPEAAIRSTPASRWWPSRAASGCRRSRSCRAGEGADRAGAPLRDLLLPPEPFCLLDEVDAPLDDANIHRFTRVLRELSGQTQFIVITHNRKTMEAADVLYGVTMEEPGLSRIVSVNLA